MATSTTAQVTAEIPTNELSDADWALVDLIEAALESDATGLTPSVVARKCRTQTDAARRLLDWMVTNRYAHTSGNGAWKRYHAGRA